MVGAEANCKMELEKSKFLKNSKNIKTHTNIGGSFHISNFLAIVRCSLHFEQYLEKNKTVFLVSHNIKLTKSADKIYLIENGRINDSGKFEELIENDTFKKLLNE